MDIHVYFVILSFVFILFLLSKLVFEINIARKNIVNINSGLDETSEAIISLKKEIDLLKKNQK